MEDNEIFGNNTELKMDRLANKILENEETTDRTTDTTNKTNLVNDVVQSIIERWNSPIEIIVGVKDTLATKIKKQSKLRPGETQEEQEKRLLKNRLLKFKSRLLFKIEKPEMIQISKAEVTRQSQLRRQKRLENETPEQTAARKRRDRISSITLRKSLQELETPEQKAERMAAEREKSRLRLHKKRATESVEERLARKQQQRDYQKNRRPQSLAMRTGKFYERHKQKQNASEGYKVND